MPVPTWTKDKRRYINYATRKTQSILKRWLSTSTTISANLKLRGISPQFRQH